MYLFKLSCGGVCTVMGKSPVISLSLCTAGALNSEVQEPSFLCQPIDGTHDDGYSVLEGNSAIHTIIME